MRDLVYDVAVSIDGFICRSDGGIQDFVPDGPHVADYRARLAGYDTAVMGRNTYEFGYQYGLAPGTRAYSHMDHYVFSSSLQFEHPHQLNIVAEKAGAVVRDLKGRSGSDIYLCGGSVFAGSLLQEQLIDRLVLKVNPVVIGEGLPLFSSPERASLKCTSTKRYENGVLLAEYDVVYES
jgi:dihydrofolate reductase